MKLFDLYAELNLDASGFERGVKSASGMGKSLASSLRVGVGGAAGYVGRQVSATTVMLGHLMADAVKASAAAGKQMVSAGMQYNAQMETYQTNFKTMLGGSAEAAQALTAELEDMASATPFAMTDLADATQTLLQFGQDSDTVLDTLQTLGDISMGDSQKLQSLTLAFAQASSSGKLMGQDLMQMINAGFNPLLTISEKTGASMGDLKDFMSDGKASSALRKQMRDAQREVKLLGDEASDGAKMLTQMSKDGAISADLLGQVFAIETAPGGRFYGAMEAASKTFNGLVSTLEDDSRALLGKVFKPLSDWMTDDLLPKGIDLIGVMDKAFDSGGLAAAVKAGGELISQYFGEWGDYALDAGAGLLANVLTGLTGDTVNKESVKAELEQVWKDASGAIDDFVATGSGVLGGIWKGLTGDETSEKGIVDEVTGWVGTANETITGFASAAGGLLGTIYEEITGLEPTAENVGSTIGGVVAVGADGLNGLLNGASTFMTDLAAEIGDDDAGTGEKISGVFSAGIDAMGELVTGSGSLMADLYAKITGDTESADKIKKFFQTTFEQPFDLLEGVVQGYGILIDELIAMLPGFENEEGENVVEQKIEQDAGKFGTTAVELDEMGYTPATGFAGQKQVEEHGYYEPDRPLDWFYEKNGGAFNMFGAVRQAQADFQGDEQASREAGDALGLLQQAVAMLTEAAASLPSAAASAVSGAKVVLNGEDVGEIILPIIAAGLARELAPSRYTGGER